MSEQYKKLIATLQSIFEMDKADLDFGIYRIINQKRDEINRFLEQDLLPQVKQAFADYADGGNHDAQAELDKLIQTLSDAGMDPEQSPKVKELRQQLGGADDVAALENDIFSKLTTFFSRYYDKGDFISQRRYKADTYAIPYEGEEVKLYWANHDQYYIKSSEHLRDYAFLINPDQEKEQAVRIKLVEADTEKDNVKAKQGEERRFVLDEANPLSIEDGELLIHFNYIPAGKKKQKDLNKAAIEVIFNNKDDEYADWLQRLGVASPTEKDPKRTLLEKHLNDYTARNSFDYFIHKDLGGFLTRELDFYIKNEVMHLDDIDDAAFDVTQQQLRKIKVLRTIAQKIIRMVAQIEDFQKKLWLKKKFVVEANYCISLGMLSDELKLEAFNNQEQIKEWVNLYSINSNEVIFNSKEELILKVSQDQRLSNLIVDTKYFTGDFKQKLLAGFDDIDNSISGLLVNGDNYQGMGLIEERYHNSIDAVYIDPPYNTSASEILYKNDYKHSSWLSLMDSRLQKVKELLENDDGLMCCTIDDVEQKVLSQLIENTFGEVAGTVSIRIKPSGRPIPNGFALSHEYAIFARNNPNNPIKRLSHSEAQINRYREKDDKGRFFWEMFRKAGSNSNRSNRPTMFYPFYVDVETSKVRLPEAVYVEELEEYNLLDEVHDSEVIVYPIKDDGSEGCWYFGYERATSVEDEFKAVKQEDETYRIYYRRRPNEGVQPTTHWSESKYSATEHGTALLKHMFGEQEVFSYPKSIHAVYDCLGVMGVNRRNESIVLDCFAGSGTTAHAVIKLDNEDQGARKFILLEMSDYFDPILMPRVKKSIYSMEWADGKPLLERSVDSKQRLIKYLKIEGYEDSLNNLNLSIGSQHETTLNSSASLHEDYMLGYWLDVETADSPSLLNIEQFEDPFNYKLNIGSGSVGATKPTKVDLVETFNYLIGLTVKTMDVIRGFKIVTGTNPKGESVLVVWRNVKEKDNAALEEFLDKQGYNPRDTEFNHIYVNGDHTLEDPQSKVKMTEIEFKRLMFDVQDV